MQMHNVRRGLSLLIALALGLAAFAAPARAQLSVVATVPDLAAIAKAVGGAQVTVKTMALPTQNPHFVDAKPSLALDLNKADLVLLVGLGLEIGWLPTLLTGARNAAIQPGASGYLDCSTLVAKLGVPDAPVDRSMGDVHRGGNPHYLIDPRAGARVARGIAARLAQLDPQHRAVYDRNLAGFLAQLEAARKQLEARMAPYRGAPIVGYHETWIYLADWLGLQQAAFVEPKPGIPPNPAHVAAVLRLARARKVRAILQEDFYPATTSKLLAQQIPATLVSVAGGTNFSRGQSYVARLQELVGKLAAAMGSKRGG
jgi:zinc/manganese transport system substrate-binding protein